MIILKRNFYSQNAVTVAKELLGKYLVHNLDGAKLSGKILETEAYVGVEDRASHEFEGKITERNKAEFTIGGHIYMYSKIEMEYIN